MPRTRQPWASESKDEREHCPPLDSNALVSSKKKKHEKSLGIQRDAKDPQLLVKLNRLGPVQVHHHLLPAETVGVSRAGQDSAIANSFLLDPMMSRGGGFLQRKQNHVRELFESRTRAEDEAAGARAPRNRLHVSSLVALLEERREMDVFHAGGGAGAGAVDMRQLAEKYGVDVERVERLVRSVNIPSVREDGGSGHGAGGSVRYVRDENGEDIPVKEVSGFGFGFVHRVLTGYCRLSGRSQSLPLAVPTMRSPCCWSLIYIRKVVCL